MKIHHKIYYRGSRCRRSDVGTRAVLHILRCPHTPRLDGPSPILAFHRQSRMEPPPRIRFARWVSTVFHIKREDPVLP